MVHTVDKLSLEQHLSKFVAITFIVWNFWSPTPSATGSYGRLADRRKKVNLKFSKSEIFEFLLCLTKVQHHYILINASQ